MIILTHERVKHLTNIELNELLLSYRDEWYTASKAVDVMANINTIKEQCIKEDRVLPDVLECMQLEARIRTQALIDMGKF